MKIEVFILYKLLLILSLCVNPMFGDDLWFSACMNNVVLGRHARFGLSRPQRWNSNILLPYLKRLGVTSEIGCSGMEMFYCILTGEKQEVHLWFRTSPYVAVLRWQIIRPWFSSMHKNRGTGN